MRGSNSLKSLSFAFICLALTTVTSTLGDVQAVSSQARIKVNKKALIQKAFKLQIPFVPNQGQIADERVRFYAKTFGGSVYVTQEGEMLYAFPLSEPNAKAGLEASKLVKVLTLKEKLLGASVAGPQGIDLARTRVNYFIGNDEGRWKSNVPTYNAVSIGEIYKGINFILKAYGKNVEKLFIVQPGADARMIRLKMEGAKSLTVNNNGELEVNTGRGVVRFSKPLAYQKNHETRKIVEVAYRADRDTYGFTTGQYDPSLPLIIDPAIEYSTFLGWSSDESGNGIAADPSGYAYVVGHTALPELGSFLMLGSDGGTDVFVAKFDPSSSGPSSLLFLTYLGGSKDDYGYGIALDPFNCPYVTGQTSSRDYPANTGDRKIGGRADIYVTKLKSDFSLSWSTYLGGGGPEAAYAIAVDNNDCTYVTGETLSTNYPTTRAAPFAKSQGKIDAVVTKLKSNGSGLLYSTYFGGTGEDKGLAIAVDTNGYAYITGETSSPNFFTKNAIDTNLSGPLDVFVAKIDPSGSELASVKYSTYLGGAGNDTASGIAVDAIGDAYVVGYTDQPDLPTTIGPFGTTGGSDAFLAKLIFDGSTLALSGFTYLGGLDSDKAHAIALDPSGNVYMAGETDSAHTDFPSIPVSVLGAPYGTEAFVAKFAGADMNLLRLIYVCGTGDDRCYGIAVDGEGNTYLTGQTASGDFPVENAFDINLDGPTDAFVTNLISNVPPVVNLDLDDQQVDEDSTLPPFDLSGAISDEDNDPADLEVTVASDNEGLVTASLDVMQLTCNLMPDQHGLATITVTATDPDGASGSDSFLVIVTSVNDFPSAGNDSATVETPNAIFIDVLANDNDVEDPNDDLTLSVDTPPNTPPNMGDVDIEGNQIKYTPHDPDGDGFIVNGTDTFTYTVMDTDGGIATGTVTVTINVPQQNVDNCPDDNNPDQLDTNQDGQGEICDDEDLDGIVDLYDNCPDTYNPDQTNTYGPVDGYGDACDDTDGDGLVDLSPLDPLCLNLNCDPWPLDPQNDVDEDGVSGHVDNCPGVWNPNQEDSDANGLGDACTEGAPLPPSCGSGNTPPCPADEEIADSDSDGIADDQEPPACVGPADCDSDGVNDGADNCIQTANGDQTDTDNDGDGDECDDDDDNDGIVDSTYGNNCSGGGNVNCDDNCPTIPNPSQTDQDNDGIGNVCDDDIDGDGLSNAQELDQGTSPTDADSDDDGVPDGSDTYPLGEVPYITFEVQDLSDADITADWLPVPPPPYPSAPQDGAPWVQHSHVKVVAKYWDPVAQMPISFPANSTVTFSLTTTRLKGVAINHTETCQEVCEPDPNNPGQDICEEICPADYSFNASNDPPDLEEIVTPTGPEATVQLYAFDYGGIATITATINGSPPEYTITLPLDPDGDGLPSVWENYYIGYGFDPFNAHLFLNPGPACTEQYPADCHDGNADVDTSLNNSYDGDGVKNSFEFRGIILDNATGVVTSHLRLDPMKKDLFVTGQNFANSLVPSPAPGVLPFSLIVPGGNAFENAGIAVHDVTRRLSFNQAIEPLNIDILVVTNKTERNAQGYIETKSGLENGYINHPSTYPGRLWTWDLKAESYVGNFEYYAIFHDPVINLTRRGTFLYHLCLMHYVYNRPYKDYPGFNTSYSNLLDPLDQVEDCNGDNGIGPERQKGKTEDKNDNAALDADRIMIDWKNRAYGAHEWNVGYDFSVFDANGNGLVENPPVGDSKNITKEYTPEEVQTHTLLHEMGHAVGIANHTTDQDCLMYELSINWDRAGHFGDEALSHIIIHNKTEQ